MAEMFTQTTVTQYRERIEKEQAAAKDWPRKYGHVSKSWRPVEPFERKSCSKSTLEAPVTGPPKWATDYPERARDTVGDDGLAGGTPKRFGGRWDVTTIGQPGFETNPSLVVSKGPHDCYCEIGFHAYQMAGKARSENFGRRGCFAKELWTNTPGELALVWASTKGANDKYSKLDAAVALE